MSKFHQVKKGEVIKLHCSKCQKCTKQKCIDVPEQYQSMIGPRTSFGEYKCLICGKKETWDLGGGDR